MVIVTPDHYQGLEFLDFKHADQLHHTKNNIITSALAALNEKRNSNHSYYDEIYKCGNKSF